MRDVLRMRSEFERLRRRRYLGLIVLALVALLLIGLALHGILDVNATDVLLCAGVAAITAFCALTPRPAARHLPILVGVAGKLIADTTRAGPARAMSYQHLPLRL